MARRHFEFGKRVADRLELYVAALGDGERALQRLRQLRKYLGHLFRRLEIELVGGKAHVLRIGHGLAGLYAHQDFLRARIRLRQIVGVVGGHQRNTALAGEPHEVPVQRPVDVQALILHFQEKVVLAENVTQLVSVGARLIVVALQQWLGDGTFQTGRKRDQSLAVFGQQVVIDARLVVKAFEKTGGHQLHQVAIAFRRLAKKHEVIGIALPGFARGASIGAARIGAAIVPAAACHVYFAADDRLHAPRRGLMIELLGGEQIPVIGDSDRGHAATGRLGDQFLDITGAIEQAVVGVQVQVNETRSTHAALIVVAGKYFCQTA
jgi:hypothetical protein